MTTDFPTKGATVSAAALQSDGKVLVAGGGAGRLDLARYTTGGALDPAFGTGGRVQTTFNPADSVFDVAVAPGGKVVVSDNQIHRFNADGTPDSTFGTGGATPAGAGFSQYEGVAVQPDGKIVAARQGDGVTFSGKISVVRLLSNGTPDPSFGTAGVAATPLTNGQDSAQVVVVQSDGKIVVGAGRADATGAKAAVLLRYNADGTPDGSFGAGGTLTLPAAPGSSTAVSSIAVQGGALLAVETDDTGQQGWIARVAAGANDTTFGGSGLVGAPLRRPGHGRRRHPRREDRGGRNREGLGRDPGRLLRSPPAGERVDRHFVRPGRREPRRPEGGPAVRRRHGRAKQRPGRRGRDGAVRVALRVRRRGLSCGRDADADPFAHPVTDPFADAESDPQPDAFTHALADTFSHSIAYAVTDSESDAQSNSVADSVTHALAYALTHAEPDACATPTPTTGNGPGLNGRVVATLPPSVVGGAKAKAKVSVVVTNPSVSPLNGPVTVRLFVSADETLDAGDVPAGAASKKLRLRTGASKGIKV